MTRNPVVKNTFLDVQDDDELELLKFQLRRVKSAPAPCLDQETTDESDGDQDEPETASNAATGEEGQEADPSRAQTYDSFDGLAEFPRTQTYDSFDGIDLEDVHEQTSVPGVAPPPPASVGQMAPQMPFWMPFPLQGCVAALPSECHAPWLEGQQPAGLGGWAPQGPSAPRQAMLPAPMHAPAVAQDPPPPAGQRPGLAGADALAATAAAQQPAAGGAAGGSPAAAAGDSAGGGTDRGAPSLQRDCQVFPTQHGLKIVWTVNARKLQSNDTQVVSSIFRLSSKQFKMVIRPTRAAAAKGGGSFKKANGKGAVELKCLDEPDGTTPVVTFGISVGSDDAMRGRITHDFARQAICSPPEEWDFRGAVDAFTQTFVICLEASTGDAS